MKTQKLKFTVGLAGPLVAILAGIAVAAGSPSPATSPGASGDAPPRSGIDVLGNPTAGRIVQPGETQTGKQDTPGKTGLGNVEGGAGTGGGVGTNETHDGRGGAGAGVAPAR